MSALEWLEALSYVVTIIGFPFAIIIFLLEQRKERQNENEEVYQRLSDEYADFLKLVLDNADLQLLAGQAPKAEPTDEQRERKFVIFEILVALFERAFLLVYEEKMSKQNQRLWSSWEDYMREWCRREDFRALLPRLLEGEDEDFQRYIRELAAQERRAPGGAAPAAVQAG
ncbi:hypothetical protein SVA_2916 [Sulfurifustis variabilis]|uniref:Uncharacterized protein n=1 Tax=Sulfurifustis variabilis TaxID=1675686 RepID=A0A1B4VBA7_9GAMM|nr:hypothetical protein [Sulfurifustis variabilis]BAU49464.1 hypothetical protein SVA_2916 [Sulfurifustis variabilis]